MNDFRSTASPLLLYRVVQNADEEPWQCTLCRAVHIRLNHHPIYGLWCTRFAGFHNLQKKSFAVQRIRMPLLKEVISESGEKKGQIVGWGDGCCWLFAASWKNGDLVWQVHVWWDVPEHRGVMYLFLQGRHFRLFDVTVWVRPPNFFPEYRWIETKCGCRF